MTKTIHQKLFEVQSQLTTVGKSGKNTFSKYDYSTLGDILAPLKPLLKEVGLLVSQSITSVKCGLSEMNNAMYSVAEVSCVTTVTDSESGDSVEVNSVGFSTDKNGDKAAYKAATGARKYGLAGMFGMEWDSVDPEDDRFDEKRFENKETKKRTSSNRLF